MTTTRKRIAINVGAGYVPGINAVIKGAGLAAAQLGWDLVGIRDGFDGLLYPERYPAGGLLPITAELLESLDYSAGAAVGQALKVDPFQVRIVDEDDMVQEVDLSDQLLESIRSEGIDAIISVMGMRGLTILYKLHRKGLATVCVPRSIENDIAATSVSFGFNSALSFTIEMLDRVYQAARASRQIFVVEVLGAHSGWIALQAAIAAGADAVVIPEKPCDVKKLAAALEKRVTPQRPYALVVVAEGATFVSDPSSNEPVSSLKASLSPLATGDKSSGYVIASSGCAAETLTTRLQLLTTTEVQSMVLGPWVRGGHPTAVDRQLGIAYGAGAIQALEAGQTGAMVSFVPPEVRFVPLTEAINKIRTVPLESGFFKIAESTGMYIGNEG